MIDNWVSKSSKRTEKHMEQRIDKINYYLNIAKAVAEEAHVLEKT